MKTKKDRSTVGRWILSIILVLLPCVVYSQTDTNLTDILKDADVVVEAQVLSKESKWTEEKTTINTMIQLKVLRIIKGAVTNNEINLSIPGGTVGNKTVGIFPTPIGLKSQERAILFLKKDVEQNNYWILKKKTIYEERVRVNRKGVDVERFVGVLTQSMKDASAYPTFLNELSKEKKSLKKRTIEIDKRPPHPMLKSETSYTKDTARKVSHEKQKRARTPEGGVK